MKLSKHERVKRSLNPCPGRSEAQRQYIRRKLAVIADELSHHHIKASPLQPRWLPEAVITPETEAIYLDSRESWEKAVRDEHGFIAGQCIGDLRASNRVRVATWYRNEDTQELYMIALIMVSPLLCEEWGALPLTRAQWCIVIPSMISTHMDWKWIHAVRKYWGNDNYQVGGTFGWYMEPCKKLTKDNSLLWTGQAIYNHVVRQYSDHISTT